MPTFTGTHRADRIDGTAADDLIFGDNGNDVLNGGAGKDRIDGGNGSDTICGGAGDDELDGGNGLDFIVYDGNRADYHLFDRGDGTIVVRDLRPNAPSGTDRLVSIERVTFAEGTFKMVDVVSANAAPVAGNDALTLAEDAGATNITATLLANDIDPEGALLSVSTVQAVSAKGATVTLSGGQVHYDPGAIFAGLEQGQTDTDSFTYTIVDDAGVTSTATVTLTITGVTQNVAPVAANDALTLSEDAGATDVTVALLSNDTDADGDVLTVTAVQAVSARGATVTLSAGGNVTYDPGQTFGYLEEGQKATDSFTYTITDAAGATSTATATITVTGVSIVPDAYYYVMEDGTSEDMLGSIIESFSMDVVAVETGGLLGTLNFDQVAGTLTFTADHASSDLLYPDADQWTYFTVVGDQGERKLIGMWIQGVNDDVIAVDDAVAIGEGETSGNLWGALVGNDVDPDDSVVGRKILSVDTTGTQGLVTFDPVAKTVTYSAAGIDLAEGETMTDTFTYEVTDGNPGSLSDFATITVTVTGGSAGTASVSPAEGDGGHAFLAAAFADGDESFAGGFESFTAFQPDLLTAAIAIG
jgi:VCBS repeat-containing protein